MLFDDLLQIALEKQASDLHLVVGQAPILRIDGNLQRITSLAPQDNRSIEKLVENILSEEQKKRFLRERELDLSYQISQNASRCRINLSFEKGNMSLSARIIPSSILSFADLNLDKNLVSWLINRPHGLILVTGPSGSGKSTVMAKMIEEINSTRKANIVTLEDPIEFVFKSKKSVIRQRELGSDMLSFAEGLKRALRQDPNVIMVGEMRDLETISTAIMLAETGHLIFATLHTFNATQTLDRIINSFPPYQQAQIRIQLSLTLVSVISQRLLERKNGGRRIAAREILIANTAIRNLIRRNKLEQIQSVLQTSSKEEMITLEAAIKKLVNEDIVSQEVANANLALNDVGTTQI